MATATGESPPICSLANRYRELSLLQIKYENLIDVCSALLRPWPSKDAAVVLEEPKTLLDSVDKSSEPATTAELDVAPELRALELVLSKAHKARAEYPKEMTATATNPVQRHKVKITTSMELATSVYKPAGKKRHPKNQAAKSCPHKKVSNERKLCTLPAIAPAPSTAPKRSPPKAVASTVRDGTKSKEKWKVEQVSLQPQREENGYALKTNGTQLLMPSAYLSLQDRFARIGDHISSVSCSNTTAEQFVGRLRRDEGALEMAHLQLLREGYTVLKDQLVSQAPDSSLWQDVRAMRQQLDQIKAHYYADTTAAGVPVTRYSQPNVITYSTTEEWLEMATCEHRRMLQQLEREIVQICRQDVLPKLMSFQCDDRSLIETKRLLSSVLGLDMKPIISEE